MDIIEQMRADWNRRARENANYYVAFVPTQSDEEFVSTGAHLVEALQAELSRLPPGPREQRRALEIGCGPGRLMIPMSEHFGEIHGVDISDEMIALAKQKLAGIPTAHAHVNSGSDLRMFEDGYFDLVYSWIVFQHIPSKDVVLGYLREAQRVLKPGGILACQVRGVVPSDSELKPGWETWTGCWFSAEEILAFSAGQDFPLAVLSGIGTQYTFTVFRKRSEREEAGPQGTVVLDVTAGTNGSRRIPTRGYEAAVSLWLSGFPKDGSLATFPVLLGDRLQAGCFLSPVSEGGRCQMNVMLPKGIPPGPMPVKLSYRGTPFGKPFEIEVVPAPPRNPKILKITDRIDLLARDRSENDGIQVSLADVEDPAAVSVAIAGNRVETMVVVCEDPIESKYVFGCPIAPGTPKGTQPVIVKTGEQELPPASIEIV